MNYVRIPKARVGVLIGPKGEYKKNLEKRTDCLIDVDSKNGMVEVSPKKGVDSLKALQVLSVVKAIGRGFPVEDAENLLDYEYYLRQHHQGLQVDHHTLLIVHIILLHLRETLTGPRPCVLIEVKLLLILIKINFSNLI